jgi:hypothetical protein
LLVVFIFSYHQSLRRRLAVRRSDLMCLLVDIFTKYSIFHFISIISYP